MDKPRERHIQAEGGIEANGRNKISLAILNDVPLIFAGDGGMILVREVITPEPTRDAEFEALLEAARVAAGFMTLFTKGTKTFRHDLNLKDTLESVSASLALDKALKPYRVKGGQK